MSVTNLDANQYELIDYLIGFEMDQVLVMVANPVSWLHNWSTTFKVSN